MASGKRFAHVLILRVSASQCALFQVEAIVPKLGIQYDDQLKVCQ
jgi:hypothetical protein